MILPLNLSSTPFIRSQILQPPTSLARRICHNTSQNQDLRERSNPQRHQASDNKHSSRVRMTVRSVLQYLHSARAIESYCG
ncbi:hypothetical protein IQ269_26270 [Tychonema sp. LEGE 07199]|uniref:hypothetical protein n=1 Tax=Microcoleaceae TaxID=1892252 RepID=UPI00187F4928|nr:MULTISPECIES: hypothetical protein [unclassified Tychonema]MBE9124210.1 hypothetical protein [Tychonema sp. LEGE 07199]MBE9135374.1 hypothetical protein [Tychonema sp. LEGE 07196]MBE9160815.1 hypothetical protein [Tychonema sp. LEGE 06208]